MTQPSDNDANYVQASWNCEKCKDTHLGNCPNIAVSMTTTAKPQSDELLYSNFGEWLEQNGVTLGKWGDKGFKAEIDLNKLKIAIIEAITQQTQEAHKNCISLDRFKFLMKRKVEYDEAGYVFAKQLLEELGKGNDYAIKANTNKEGQHDE